jgi:O-acetyl-ADP-ribose deacetylase (regulator of RNase III)
MATVSKAFYKKSVVPQLLYRTTKAITNNKRDIKVVEVWTTTCIVTNFCSETPGRDTDTSGHSSSVLINPANAELTGCSRFSYFPRGGPVPTENVVSMHKDWQPLGYVSNWGGMEVGEQMVYPVSVVDGLVHNYAGWKLKAHIQWLRLKQQQTIDPKTSLCPIGSAIRTISGDLHQYGYQSIVHTTPPFYQHDTNPEQGLAQCYQSVLDLAFSTEDTETTLNQPFPIRAAIPLLGAGARGFPIDVACQIACDAVIHWFEQKHVTATSSSFMYGRSHTVAFGLLEETVARQLISLMEKRLVTESGQST